MLILIAGSRYCKFFILALISVFVLWTYCVSQLIADDISDSAVFVSGLHINLPHIVVAVDL